MMDTQQELLDKAWKEYVDAMKSGDDAEAKQRTYANVLEIYIRQLERIYKSA